MRERFVQFESHADDSAVERERNEVREALLSHVESSLDKIDYFVGKGSIAKVVRLAVPGRAKPICAKFIDTAREGGTVDYTIRKGESPAYNNLGLEAAFLDTLRDLDENVRVPEPYYYWEKSFSEKGITRVKSFLVMELLDAVSIDDVMTGRKKLPESFVDITFFSHVRRFVEKMHKKEICHHDLQEGNVMIDIQTGLPRVIDFGAATKGTEGTDWRPGDNAKPLISDESGVRDLERRMKEYLTGDDRFV